MDVRVRLPGVTFLAVAALILITTTCKLSTFKPATALDAILSGSEEGAANAASAESGTTRERPIALGTLASIPGWDMKVLELLRGEDALKVINAADWQAESLPEGQEYVLARIFVRCTALDDSYHSLGISELFITGNHDVAYGDTMDGWPQPEFLFEDMYTAEAVEGWIDGVIPIDEENLMVVWDVKKNGDRFTRFFALEDGVSISPSPESSSLKPNELGMDFDDPAALGQQAITPEWEVTLLEAVRGREAEAILEPDNSSYSPPDTGMERLLLHVRLRYISSNEIPIWVGADSFYVMDRSGNMIQNRLIYTPARSDRVWLARMILPGAELEGWVAVTIPEGTYQPIIAFDPDRNSQGSPDQNLRYLTFR